MVAWLYTLPELVVVGMAASSMACLALALPRLIQRLPMLAPNDSHSDFVLRLQATLFTMCALILTFTLVEADGNFRRVDSLVSAEASQIDRLDRLLFRYGDPRATEVRAGLRTYTQSIVQDDWPEMLRGSESEKTRQAFAPVSRGVLTLEPRPGRQTEIYSEMLRSFNAVAEARDARLNGGSTGLPGVYWEVVLFAVGMLLIVTCTIEMSAFRFFFLACQMSVLGAFVGFVFVTDQPFKGPNGVGTADYVRSLKHMEGRV